MVCLRSALSPVERYHSALALASSGEHAQAREMYTDLVAEYPGQIEFAMGFAKATVASGTPEALFVKLQHMSQIVIRTVFETGALVSERKKVSTLLQEFDVIVQQAIAMLRTKPLSPQDVYTVTMWRGNLLHAAGLAMLSTDSRSRWGRRMLTLAHATKVIAAAEAGQEQPRSVCHRREGAKRSQENLGGRQFVWGWANQELLDNDNDVTVR